MKTVSLVIYSCYAQIVTEQCKHLISNFLNSALQNKAEFKVSAPFFSHF